MNNNNSLQLQVLQSQLWDARMALLDSRYHHQCTVDLWKEILRLFDEIDAFKPEPETEYLTRDQMADLLGNDAYIHVNDYEDLEAVSYSMMHPTPVGRFGIDPILR
tara:strand:+ start:184 stop:501 length:318 start_codon:yes stop_codon:yes gene_type:complete